MATDSEVLIQPLHTQLWTQSMLAMDFILSEHLPHNATRDTLKCLLQVYKTHVD